MLKPFECHLVCLTAIARELAGGGGGHKTSLLLDIGVHLRRR